ncbi:MAG: hypothetical protein U0610_00735 [bacterium]
MLSVFPIRGFRVRLVPLTLLLALVAGCGDGSNELPLALGAEPGVDGAGQVVPTVDISGSWQGSWYSNKTPATGLLANLTVAQNGNDFIGNLEVVGAVLIQGNRPVTGTVFGNKLESDFDSGVAVADCFADIKHRTMTGTYQFRFPFPDEFGHFNMVHD